MDKHIVLSKSLHRLNLLRGVNSLHATRDLPLHGKQVPVIMYIMEHEGTSQSEIAQNLGVTAQCIATSTTRLANSGLIVKEGCPDNLRCNRLYSTDEGRKAARECIRRLEEADSVMCKGLSDDEMDTLCALIDRLIDNISPDCLKDKSDAALIDIITNK